MGPDKLFASYREAAQNLGFDYSEVPRTTSGPRRFQCHKAGYPHFSIDDDTFEWSIYGGKANLVASAVEHLNAFKDEAARIQNMPPKGWDLREFVATSDRNSVTMVFGLGTSNRITLEYNHHNAAAAATALISLAEWLRLGVKL